MVVFRVCLAGKAALPLCNGQKDIDDKQTVFRRKRHFAAEIVHAVADASQTVAVDVGVGLCGKKAVSMGLAFAEVVVFRADKQEAAAQVGAQGDGFLIGRGKVGNRLDGVVEQISVERT